MGYRGVKKLCGEELKRSILTKEKYKLNDMGQPYIVYGVLRPKLTITGIKYRIFAFLKSVVSPRRITLDSYR